MWPFFSKNKSSDQAAPVSAALSGRSKFLSVDRSC